MAARARLSVVTEEKMAIYFDEEKKIFYLESGCMSYVMQIS